MFFNYVPTQQNMDTINWNQADLISILFDSAFSNIVSVSFLLRELN